MVDEEHKLQSNGSQDDERGEALKKLRSATSVSMSPELFEKLYLSPQNKIKGELRKTFGNPTAIPISGFVLCLTPLSMDLMGWRGAGGNGAASIPVFFFQGGILMTIGGILEWILGNTFPSVVFTVFGTFYASYGGVLNPNFYSYQLYAPPANDTTVSVNGLSTKGFNASIAYWLLFMGLICLIFLVCSLRTNTVFVVIFLTLAVAFSLLTGAFLLQANAYPAVFDPSSPPTPPPMAHKLIVGAGAMLFICAVLGWYLLLVLLLAAVDFPLNLPVGDLSHLIKGASEKK